MYLLLLGFGVGLSAAGVLLAGADLLIREGSFDPGLFTPGIVAAVGGFLLIGLGLVLRTLQRVERALTARASVAQEQISELASDQSGQPDRFAIAPPARPASHPAAAVARTRDDPPANGAAERSPQTARLGDRPLPALPKVAARRAPEANPETDTKHFGRAGNGTRNVVPQDAAAQSADAYDEPVPISVLRSGVVDGMAYTLYSDGSIEAQLPQGILRFGSITELRHHLEQSA